MSPALTGRFFITKPAGKSRLLQLNEETSGTFSSRSEDMILKYWVLIKWLLLPFNSVNRR